MLGTYIAIPIQISAQEFLEQDLLSDQISEEIQQVDHANDNQSDETNNVIDLDETESSEPITEKEDNDEQFDVQEDLIEDEVKVEEDGEASDVVPNRNEGYSHIESSPGIVVVTTPIDATIETLVTYLDEYFLSTAIQSLTVHGMIDTGINSSWDLSFGLSKFTGMSYLELVDVETVGQGSIMSLFSLRELYLPKAKTLGSLAFWGNSSLIKLNAPMVDTVGENVFYGVSNLEIMIMPSWHNIRSLSGLSAESEGPTTSLKEISTGNFDSNFSVDTFPNVTKQTVNTKNSTIQASQNYIIFSGVEELVVSGPISIYASSFHGYPTSVISMSSETLTGVNLSAFTSLQEIDFDEQLTNVFANSFAGTKLETLRLSSVVNNVNENTFSGAEYLKEIYLPRVNISNLPNNLNLPGNLELLGTTSSRLGGFQSIANNNPSVLFAATESNEALPLEDTEIVVGGSETLKTDLSSYILNEDLSQTAFELTQNWFFEDSLIGIADTYTITDMNQSNVGTYHYSVNLTPTGDATYSGSRESRRAQIDISNEVQFESDFSINSVVGELQELKLPFTSNVTNINSTIQITVPNSLKVDEENIELFLDNSSSSLPLGATVTMVDQVITISNFPLLVGFKYHINLSLMPIAISEQDDEIKVEFRGNYDPLKLSGDVLITSGDFKVSIPDQIKFEEVSLDFSSIQSIIKKENQLEIDITSFTALEESWEIMVSATPFFNTDNQMVDEDIISLIYYDNGHLINLTEQMLLSSGSFSGQLDYDFRTGTWENHSYVLTQLEEEGFQVLVGNDYYKLESQQSYTTELNFTIQYSP